MKGFAGNLSSGAGSGRVHRDDHRERFMNGPFQNLSHALVRLALVVLLAGLASACGDFSGGSSGGSGGSQPSQLFSLSGQAGGVQAFQANVYPIVRQYCVSCHAGAGPGTGAFAGPDVNAAYAAAAPPVVSLGTPSASRLVVKLTQLHNCWSNCTSDAATMMAAIQQWATDINFDSSAVTVSGALSSSSAGLNNAIVDTGDERYTQNLIALYEFKEGMGTTAFDTSGVAPALDLEIIGSDVQWLSNWGVAIEDGRLRGTRTASRKLFDQIASAASQGTGQYTVEAWVVPANIDQEGPARIITYSANSGSRNFTLGQVKYNYNFRNRSINPNASDNGRNGQPDLQTYDADRDAQDRLQHVVMTYDQVRGRRIYVDGVFTDDSDPIGAALLWNWDPDHRLVIGDEPNGGRQWKGQVRLLAIYKQALKDEDIQQNFAAGVGQRLLMRFDVSQWVGAGSSVEFTVTDFDPYSYLFCQPTIRATGPNAAGSRVSNLRILVNGTPAPTGQGFERLDTQLTGGRQELSRQCAVIPKGNLGPGGDQFTLVFEHLGGFQNIVVNTPLPPADILLDPTPVPHEGTRNFDRVNATLAEVTGQPPSTADATFAQIEQQLPPNHDVRAFVSSNQVAIAKIALDYCDALVESPTDRAAYFPGFDFNAVPQTAFATPADRDLIFDPLYDRMVGDVLLLQPSRAEVRAELDALVDTLLGACSSMTCDATRTQTMVKATCAAVAGSAAVTLH